MENIDLENIKIEETKKQSKNCLDCVHEPVCVVYQNMQQMLNNVSQAKHDDSQLINDDSLSWLTGLAKFCNQFLEVK